MIIDEIGSKLLMMIFNKMTTKQKQSFSVNEAAEIVDFMTQNGYRFVFEKWYLQEKPLKITKSSEA